jgi:hypothetical protein
MRFDFGSSVNILGTSNLLIRAFRRVLECAQPVPLVDGSALSVLSGPKISKKSLRYLDCKFLPRSFNEFGPGYPG